MLAALLAAPAAAQGQRLQWSDAVYVPGRWQGGRLLRLATTNPATDTLALVMRVDYFASPPRWRAEVRRSPDGTAFGEPEVIIGSGATAHVATPLGATPLEQHALARDSLVRAALAVLDAQGRRQGAASGRIVERASSGGVFRVAFRRTARTAQFSDDLLIVPGSAPGRRLIASGIRNVGDQRSASVVATAGARGVDQVQTPRGAVAVRPDTLAIARMESFSVGPARLEEFLRAGRLGPYGTRVQMEGGRP